MNMFFRWVETTRKTWRSLDNWDSPTSKKWKPVSVEFSQVQSCDTVASLRLLVTSLRLNTQESRTYRGGGLVTPTDLGNVQQLLEGRFLIPNSRSTFSRPFSSLFYCKSKNKFDLEKKQRATAATYEV